MHVSFSKDDSLYKIFKIIKKIPPYKNVTIKIDSNHELFEHKRWANQLFDLIQQQHLTATFIVENQKTSEYLSEAGLNTVYSKRQGFAKYRYTIKDLLFSTKSIHQQLLAQKNAPSYLIVFAEIAVLALVGSFFWGLISPEANIIITPTNIVQPIVYQYSFYPAGSGQSLTSEMHNQIIIPYYEETIPYTHEMTVDVKDITYVYTPSHGVVELENTTEKEVSLVGGTQLITSSGDILFTMDRWINIPPGNEENPGKTRVAITARDYTDQGDPIGAKGNIDFDQTLLIKNLAESYEEKKIIARPVRGFDDGTTVGEGTVLQEDIQNIEQKILAYMKDNKKNHIQDQVNEEDRIIIPFKERIIFSVNEFVSTSTIGDSATFVDGYVTATLQYTYITRQDFLDAVEFFIDQRPTEGQFLIDHDPFSLTFYEYRPDMENPEFFTSPIGINTIRGYDFKNDTFHLGDEIALQVAGKKRSDALQDLLEYEEVFDVKIKLSPPRYDTLPQEAKRINLSHTTIQNQPGKTDNK